jgi:hypothetical protein
MASLLIFRRSADAPKLKVADIKAAMNLIHKRARVQRDELAEFMLNGGFKKLPIVKQSEVDSDDWHRPNDKGWKIPESCLGRKGEATLTQRESVRLWIKQQLTEYGVDPDSFSVVWTED